MRLIPALVLICVAAPVTVFAQAESSRATASAILGAGTTYDDEGSLGSGAIAGARLSHHLFGRTSGEIAVDVLMHDRDVGYFQADGRTLILSASLVRRFGDDRVQPYILGGGLIASHEGTLTFGAGTPDAVTRHESSTNPGFTVGGGLAVRVGTRWEIGPEFRLLGMFIDDGSDPATGFWFGLRAAYRW